MNKNVEKKILLPCIIFQRRLKNCQKRVPGLLDEIYQWMVRSGTKDGHIANVQIVLAEVLNNVIKHGFKPNSSGEIQVEINLSSDRITVRVTDDGIAFAPPDTKQTPLKLNGDISDLPEGGFGWFLINEITSSCEAHRKDNKNILILDFNRNP